MSLLRQRASEARVESTLRARSPADARAWFVSVRSCRSDVELKLLLLHASASRGATSIPSDVTANANATITTRRRGSRRNVGDGSGRTMRRAVAWIIDR